MDSMFKHDYLQRQIAFLGAQGDTAEQITQKLSGQVDAQLIEQVLAGENPEKAQADVLLPLVLKQFSNRDDALEASVRYFHFKKELAEITASARGLLGGLSGYVAMIGILALVVFSIFAVFVVPQFEEVFAGFGADLPPLTRAVVNLHNLAFSLGTVLLLLPFVIAGWLFYTTRSITKVLALSKKPGWRASRFSPHRKLVRFHCRVINIWLIQLAHERGRTLADALTQSDEIIRDYAAIKGFGEVLSAADRTALETCENIGTLQDELEYRVSTTMMEMPMKLVRQRTVLQVVAQIVLAVAIGTIVIALYLPIFKLGAVI